LASGLSMAFARATRACSFEDRLWNPRTTCFFRLPMRLTLALVRDPPEQAQIRAERSQSIGCGALPSVAPQESRNFVMGGVVPFKPMPDE
jgi:hypothetical protein